MYDLGAEVFICTQLVNTYMYIYQNSVVYKITMRTWKYRIDFLGVVHSLVRLR